MAINLQKGQIIDLRKSEKGELFDLSQVTIGLGWDVKKKESSFFGKLFGESGESNYDLDAIAFLLDSNGKVANLGRTVKNTNGAEVTLYESDIVFFNSLKHPSGNIWLTGDNTTGAGDGDDEQIIVKLNSLESKYQKIVFLVTIYKGKRREQHFGLLENAYIRAVDAKGKEIAQFNLSGNSSLNGARSMLFSEVYREGSDWKFKAIGDARTTDDFIDILKEFR